MKICDNNIRFLSEMFDALKGRERQLPENELKQSVNRSVLVKASKDWRSDRSLHQIKRYGTGTLKLVFYF